jgi:DNA-binding NarL/FixJ family response regulator
MKDSKRMNSIPIIISIVEDDEPARLLLAGLVGRTPGFSCVSHYGEARQAVKSLPQDRPDVVLMDINLPQSSGVECVRQLKPMMASTQFVMLTVYEDADHIFNALRAGATGYLLKSTPRDELFAAIEEVNRGGSPMTSNIARKVVQCFQQSATTSSEVERLSPREEEILNLLAQGYLYKEISESLHLAVPTVSTYIRRMYDKLHVDSRGQAVAKYLRRPGGKACHQF